MADERSTILIITSLLRLCTKSNQAPLLSNVLPRTNMTVHAQTPSTIKPKKVVLAGLMSS